MTSQTLLRGILVAVLWVIFAAVAWSLGDAYGRLFLVGSFLVIVAAAMRPLAQSDRR